MIPKSAPKISRALTRRGFRVGPDTVRRLLYDLGYRLRVNRKRLNKKQDPERDLQMKYLARKRRAFQEAGFPVISVDAKQRELVGNFRNPGRTYRRRALEVLESDYPSEADGVAIPYGIYDITRNEGFVVVGTSHQTADFAVSAIRRWWIQEGQRRYPGKDHLMINADCGGANGNQSWLWKHGLQGLADEFGLMITVIHLPTSASKWNQIEHRLFCRIEANWAGQPLKDYETVLKFIRTTRTQNGLRVRAALDKTDYRIGLTVSKEQRERINLKLHYARPQWNYTIAPCPNARKLEK